MNWVKPKLGWADASSKKNSPGLLSTLQNEAAVGVVIGGSFLQVPACQPDSIVGAWGLLGAITEAVSAEAGTGIAPVPRPIPTQITKKVIQASPNAASLLQKSIPNQPYPKIGT